jgi:hypothetical protein
MHGWCTCPKIFVARWLFRCWNRGFNKRYVRKLQKSEKKLKRLRKHIAFILFGIFFFPILFQSIHIVWHHSNSFKCNHHQCYCEIIVKPVTRNTSNISKEEDHCPICEYEFSLNEIPQIFKFRSFIPILTFVYNEIAVHQKFQQVFSIKTPRAPPVLIS